MTEAAKVFPPTIVLTPFTTSTPIPSFSNVLPSDKRIVGGDRSLTSYDDALKRREVAVAVEDVASDGVPSDDVARGVAVHYDSPFTVAQNLVANDGVVDRDRVGRIGRNYHSVLVIGYNVVAHYVVRNPLALVVRGDDDGAVVRPIVGDYVATEDVVVAWIGRPCRDS